MQRRTHDPDAPFIWLAYRRPHHAQPPVIHESSGSVVGRCRAWEALGRPGGVTDWSTKAGATRQAEQIAKYWHDKGYPEVRAWAESVSGRDRDWTVRTNLIGGLPPRSAAVVTEAA
jgi:hypothetical protein